MTFQQLRYLLEVQRTGSISKAADNLFVSRPSVSFSINSLEEEMGYPIFLRTRQGLTPTPQGKQFLEYANHIWQSYRGMSIIGQETPIRSVNIGISPYPPTSAAIARLVHEFPDRDKVTFSFLAESFNIMIEKVESFSMDVAVFSRFGTTKNKIEAMLIDKGLQWKILDVIPSVVYLGPGHRLYNETDITLSDLRYDTFLDIPTREISRHPYLVKNINIPPERVIPCKDGSIRYMLIEKGLAYTIGRIPAQRTIDRYRLRCIPIPELGQPLFCITNPEAPLTTEAQRFLEILDEEIKLYKHPK